MLSALRQAGDKKQSGGGDKQLLSDKHAGGLPEAQPEKQNEQRLQRFTHGSSETAKAAQEIAPLF